MKQKNNGDQQFSNAFKSLRQNSYSAPDGLKESILQNVLRSQLTMKQLTPLQCFFFTRPLVAAGSLACVVSFALWCSFGNAYLNLLSNLF
jgi:hypothetical protein